MQGILNFMIGGGHLGPREKRCQGDFGAFTHGRKRGIMGHIATDNGFGALRLVDVLYLAEASGHGDDVDGGITTTHADYLVRRNLQRALVECFQELDATDAVRCI